MRSMKPAVAKRLRIGQVGKGECPQGPTIGASPDRQFHLGPEPAAPAAEGGTLNMEKFS